MLEVPHRTAWILCQLLSIIGSFYSWQLSRSGIFVHKRTVFYDPRRKKMENLEPKNENGSLPKPILSPDFNFKSLGLKSHSRRFFSLELGLKTPI